MEASITDQRRNRSVPALISGTASQESYGTQPPLINTIRTDPIPVPGGGGNDELLGCHYVNYNNNSTPSTNATQENLVQIFPPNQSSLTDEEKFQSEVKRWEHFYDQMHNYLLLDKKINGHVHKNVSKTAANFSIDQDGTMYYSKSTKDGTGLIRVVVIRSYAERVKICRSIHLDTGDPTLHNRRDKMLELVGHKYYWKGQRRDICQCIASCEVCSIGLGAKRKTKPPAQKRDVPHGGPPKKKRKKEKVENPSIPKVDMSSDNNGSSTKRDDLEEILQGSADLSASMALSEELLLPSVTGSQVTEDEEWVEQLQVKGQTQVEDEEGAAADLSSECKTEISFGSEKREGQGGVKLNHSTFEVHGGGREVCGNDSLESTLNFKQIFTTIDEDDGSDQAPSSPLLDIDESPLNKSDFNLVTVTENLMEKIEKEVSIYKLLFNLPSVSSSISPSVIEAVHMGMKETVDVTSCCETSDVIMRQILSLGPEYNVIISPSCASAYSTAVFASMIHLDPLSVSSQISSKTSSLLAVIHDACCAHMHTSDSDLGPVKTCTGLTGSYNWNLGDATYPMDRDMLKMALHSNRVAAVFYQPYAYIERSKHLSLREVCSICHSRGYSEVTVIVDATTISAHFSHLGRVVMAEVKHFFEQGADMILLPPTDKLGGGSRSCVLVGITSLLNKVWRSIVLLQKQICLPLLCQPHELVGTVVAYKALQDDGN